jgi:hypothetical protein
VQRLIDPIDGTADDNITTDDNGGHSKYGEMTNYTVTVHSRPNPDSNDDNEERDTWTTARKRRMINNNNNDDDDEDDDDEEDNDDTKTKPWVITPNFFALPFAHALSSGFFVLVQGWGTFFTPLALAAFVAAFVMAYGSLWEK